MIKFNSINYMEVETFMIMTIRKNFKTINLNYKPIVNLLLTNNGISPAWWSKFLNNKIELTFFRFIELCLTLKINPTIMIIEDSIKFKELIKEYHPFIEKSNFNFKENSKELTYKAKLLLKEEYNNSSKNKTNFLSNNSNLKDKISPKTLKRIFDNKNYLFFRFLTFLIITNELNIDLKDFFNKLEVTYAKN